MVQGAYLCPDLPGHIVTAMVRQYASTHRARRRRKTCRRPSRGTGYRADLQVPKFGGEREPGADLHRKQGLAQRYRVNRDTLAWGPGCGGQLEDASVDAARKVST